MARGGSRANAGRKSGTGNKSNEEARRRAHETGETPLDYMLRVMRDPENDDHRRDDMAKAAAGYVHSKLAAIEHTGKDGKDLIPEVTDEMRVKALAVFLAKSRPPVWPKGGA